MTVVQFGCQSGNIYTETVNSNPNTGYTYTYPSAVGSGHLVVFGGINETRSIIGVTGTNISFSLNGANTNNATAGWNASQWKGVATGSVASSQLELSGASTVNNGICFIELANNESDQSGSVANGASADATTTHISGSVTPPSAVNAVVATSYVSGGTVTPDAGLTSITTGYASMFFAYRLQTAATAQQNDLATDTSRYSAMRIGAFAGTASGATCARSLMLMGVGGC